MPYVLRLLGVLALLVTASVAQATDFRAKDSPYTYEEERRIREVITFAAEQTGYLAPSYLPEIRFHTLEEINKTVQGITYSGVITTYAYFMPGTDSITLFEGFTFGRDDDVLAHEVAHWLHDINGTLFPCIARREAAAFRVQAAYIKRYNIRSPIPAVSPEDQALLICPWEYATFESKIYRSVFPPD